MAKKEDISNSTLATLLVVAIVVSVGGTYVVLQRAPGITGLYTGTSQQGTLSFNEMGVLSIVLRDTQVSFGNISQTGDGMCIVNSYDAQSTNTGNCLKGTAGADSLLLENDGNTNANVSITVASPFSLGTGGAQAVKSSEPGSRVLGCTGNVQTNFANISASPVNVCDVLASVDTADQIQIDFQLYIGQDLVPGNYTENVTFLATQA
jgi:hypothetical protein